MRLSARNQIPATVTAVTPGEATANIELDAGGVRLVATITMEATRELGLAKGSRVTAVIKASDVIIAVELSPRGNPLIFLCPRDRDAIYRPLLLARWPSL